MALNNFARCLAFTLQAEGGFVDNPDDPGNATNLGITIGTLSDWLGRPATVQEVRDLTPATAGIIYERRYWQTVNGDNLPLGVDLCVFDFAVNAGPARSAMRLQGLLGVTQDGAIGPATIAAAAKVSPGSLIVELGYSQLAYYRDLPGFAEFGAGWTARVRARQMAALGML